MERERERERLRETESREETVETDGVQKHGPLLWVWGAKWQQVTPRS